MKRHTQRLHRGPRLRRREVLSAAGAAFVGVAAGPAAAVAGTPGEDGTWLPGFVESVESGRTVMISTPDRDAPVAVDLVPGAQARRKGAVPLTAFQPGEEVVARGAWAGDRFEATEFETLYRLVDGTVRDRGGDVVQTGKAAVRLSSETEPRTGSAAGYEVEGRPTSELKPGDRFVTLGRRNRRTDEVTAILIGEVTR